jgi:hypothetical protein
VDIRDLVGEIQAYCGNRLFELRDVVFLPLDSSGQIIAVRVCLGRRDSSQCDQVVESGLPDAFRDGFDTILAGLSVV